MIVDSMPIPVCHPARNARCRQLREAAKFRKDAMAKQFFLGAVLPRGSSSSGQFFLGFKRHVRLTRPGVITAAVLTPTNVHDLAAALLLAGQHR